MPEIAGKLRGNNFKWIIECTPKSRNFVKLEANVFFDPELSFDNEDSKKRLNEEVGEIGLFGVGSSLFFKIEIGRDMCSVSCENVPVYF